MAMTLSEEYGTPLKIDFPTSWERYRFQVDNHPDDLALVAVHQPAELYGIPNVPLDDEEYAKTPYLRWKYKSLGSAVDQFARGLEAHNVTTGTAFITFIPNGAEIIMSIFASNKIGCPLSSISPANLVNLEETSHMVKVCLANAKLHKAVIIVHDAGMAAKVDALEPANGAVKIIINGPGPTSDWIEFAEVMRSSKSIKEDGPLTNGASNGAAHVPNDECVFFTSGTTSLPKGCRWVYPQISVITEMKKELPGMFQHGDKFASVMPNNHSYAFIFTMLSIGNGVTVCYPSPTFDAQVMFSVLKREKCTHVALVPTMVHGLRGVKAATGEELPHLRSIALGGAVLTPALLQMCKDELGVQEVENAYGMTDGVFIGMGSRSNLDDFISGNDVAVGMVVAGSGLKVCAPGELTPLPRNQSGELHSSGPTLCDGYVGKTTDDFYTSEDGRKWIKTGDEARMDDRGRIFIVGRFKDIIIRGGKNLGSNAMEAVLAKVPKLAPLQVQIVAAPDPYAGEVPVAVVEKKVDAATSTLIQDTLRATMGREFVPDEVIYIGDLGLNQYPRGVTMKVKKHEIATLVKTYRAERDASNGDVSSSQLAKDVRKIWASAVGLPVDRMSNEAVLADFADSITLMRVRDRIKRQTGKTLTIVEMANAATIGEQIELLKSRSADDTKPALKATPQREGPPTTDDMVHLVEEPELFEATKEVILEAISPYGLAWNDVQEVIPAYDFAAVMAQTGIFDSWNFKFAMLPNGLDKTRVRAATETLLKNNPMLPSFLVWNQKAFDSELALHVTLKPSQKLMDIVIEDAGAVKTVEELKNIALKYPFPKHATFPGPLIRMLLYDVEETKSCGFVVNVNHATIDASYAQIFFEDLDRAFGSPGAPEATVQPHPKYKMWADSYYSLKNSPEARRAVKWHYNRLKSISTHRKAVYPAAPSRVPYDDAILTGADGVQYSFEAPGIRAFRQEHRAITAPIFLKAALALVNTHRTKHTHALFANLEAARTAYPFIPKAMAETGQYEATEVAGPTFQSVINLVDVKPEEKIVDFLHRMQEDQTNLTKHASAPLRELMSALGEDGKMIPEITQSQVYNWVPGMGTTGTNPNVNFEVVNAVVRPQVGLAVNAGLGGLDSSTQFMHIRGDSLSDDEMLVLAKDLEAVTKWMTEKENWLAPVGGFVEVLEKKGVTGA